jgi:hypothetical protein
MKYFLGFLASIALVVLVFILVLRGFSSGSSGKSLAVDLSTYASTDTEMTLLVDGPENADQGHQGYRITIGRSQSSIDILQGYQRTVTATKTYPNNQEAYETFLRALNGAGFAKGDTASKNTDERGICPMANRYIYEVVSGSDPVQRFWSASCTRGTFQGNASQVQNLFRGQIPDFSQVTTGLNI